VPGPESGAVVRVTVLEPAQDTGLHPGLHLEIGQTCLENSVSRRAIAGTAPSISGWASMVASSPWKNAVPPPWGGPAVIGQMSKD